MKFDTCIWPYIITKPYDLAFNWLIVLTVLLFRPQTYTSIDTGCRFSSGIQGQGYRVFTLKLTDLRKVGGGRLDVPHQDFYCTTTTIAKQKLSPNTSCCETNMASKAQDESLPWWIKILRMLNTTISQWSSQKTKKVYFIIIFYDLNSWIFYIIIVEIWKP